MTTPPPDTKDWTFVIEQGCRECGFVPPPPVQTAARLRATIPVWQEVLAADGAAARPAEVVWSPVEYACHVRDTCALFGRRLALMLTADDPVFDNWDQDAAAVEGDYAHQDAAVVSQELAREAEQAAAAFDAVRDDQWDRPGRRSNGSQFTVGTFAVYFLHDVEHHVWDVTGRGQ